jgi:flagellar basal-body rod modification protein FlgD
LGRDVTVQSDVVMLADGKTASTYEVGAGASNVTAKIFDPLGRNVRTMTGLPAVSGTSNPLGWDGLDDYGNAQLAGKYTVVLTAKDAAGNNIAIQPSRSARVEDVRFREGEIIFGLDGGETASSITVKSAS